MHWLTSYIFSCLVFCVFLLQNPTPQFINAVAWLMARPVRNLNLSRILDKTEVIALFFSFIFIPYCSNSFYCAFTLLNYVCKSGSNSHILSVFSHQCFHKPSHIRLKPKIHYNFISETTIKITTRIS